MIRKSGTTTTRKSGTTTRLTLDRIYLTPDLDCNQVAMVEWSPDSKLLTYVLNNATGVHMIALDVATGKKTVLFDWSCVLATGAAMQELSQYDVHGESVPWGIGAEEEVGCGIPYYDWSPTGKAMLLAPSNSGPYYLLDIASGELSPQLPISPEAEEVDFSPDGRWISYTLDYNIYLYDTLSGATTAVTQGGWEGYRYGDSDANGDLLLDAYWWSPDSTRIAFLVLAECPVPIFSMQNLSSPTGQLEPERFPNPGDPIPATGLIVAGPQGQLWIPNTVAPGYSIVRVRWIDSNRLAVQYLNREQNHLVLAIADATTGYATAILEERSANWINLGDDLHFLRGGEMFLWSSERDSYRHLYLYGIDGRQLAQLTSGNMAAVNVRAIDEERGAIYFRAYPPPYLDGQVMRVTYRIEDGEVVAGPVHQITQGPGAHGVVFSPDASHYADFVSTVTTPPVLNLYDSSGKLLKDAEKNESRELTRMLQEVEFPTPLRAAKIGHPSDHLYLCHRILRPVNMRKGQRYPAIVYLYGGPAPGGSARTVVNKWVHVPDLWSQMMAQNGYVVYSIDGRGSCEAPRGHEFESAIAGELGFVEMADQLQGVKYLKSLPFVDPERIGVFGGSFGGFLTLSLLLRHPDVFKAGIAFAPVTDWSVYDATYTERYMGMPTVNVAGYALTSLLQLAPNLRSKLLLLHGTEDQDVHLHHTCNLLAALTSAGKDVELMLYPGMTHVDFFEVSLLGQRLFERITRFIVENL